MGNYISCGSFTANSRKTVKIIHLSSGSLQEFETAMKAAEVMVENPQHLVCHFNSLQMGRRIAALSADEDLEIGEIYFLIPMAKLNSVLCPSDMASLAGFVAGRRKSNDIAKILPLFADSLQEDGPANASRGHFQEPAKAAGFAVPKLQLDDLPEETLAMGKRGLRKCRYYWKPALDTITESPRSLKA